MTRHRDSAPSSRIPSTERAAPETFCTSGTSPTVHLIGVGQVGLEFLDLLAGSASFRLIAATDSSGTILKRDWLDPRAIARHKGGGRPIRELEGSDGIRTEVAVDVIDADIVVDTAPAEPLDVATARGDAALRRGGRLALASKAALCASVDRWLDAERPPRVGCNAVLGGTGVALLQELDELRAHGTSTAHCANATTTAIVEIVEAGGSIEDGIAHCDREGILEPDPELDLEGKDAAVKLALIAGILRGSPVDPASVDRPDVRDLDEAELRARASRGATTRLVGRVDANGALSLRFEELPRTSPLVAPWDRVVYSYELENGDTRLHIGAGVGPRGTAEALFRDVEALGAIGGAR